MSTILQLAFKIMEYHCPPTLRPCTQFSDVDRNTAQVLCCILGINIYTSHPCVYLGTLSGMPKHNRPEEAKVMVQGKIWMKVECSGVDQLTSCRTTVVGLTGQDCVERLFITTTLSRDSSATVWYTVLYFLSWVTQKQEYVSMEFPGTDSKNQTPT